MKSHLVEVAADPYVQSEMKDKKFDAVRMMREIRDKLSRIYLKDMELEERELQSIREKYRIKA